MQRQRGTCQPSGHSPSLLLVTGMLWTVRSLKQDPVSTCSSTELRTKAWRSARGQERSFRGMQPTLAMGTSQQQAEILQDLLVAPGGKRAGVPRGPQQPQTYLFSAVSEWPPSTRTSRSRRRAGRGSSVRERAMQQAARRQGCARPLARPPHLPVAVVDAEGDGRRVEEQPELILKHLLLEALDGSALSLVGFLQAGSGQELSQVPPAPHVPSLTWRKAPTPTAGPTPFPAIRTLLSPPSAPRS